MVGVMGTVTSTNTPIGFGGGLLRNWFSGSSSSSATASSTASSGGSFQPGIQFEKQQLENNCAATAFANAAKLMGIDITQQEVMQFGLAPTLSNGVTPQQIPNTGQNLGIPTKFVSSNQEFLQNAQAGKPQIAVGVIQGRNGQPAAHAFTVAGSDQQGNLTVIDPLVGKPQSVPVQQFLRTSIGAFSLG